jgi:hypothetical protein
MQNTSEFSDAPAEQPSTECTGCGGRVFDARFKKCPACRAKGERSVKVVREDDVEGEYVKAREKEGKLVLKVKVLGRPGYPDRLVLGDTDAACAVLRRTLDDHSRGFGFELRPRVEAIIAAAIHFAELKKQANSRFQPKQKTIIPMLRKRGFKVDIVHGGNK